MTKLKAMTKTIAQKTAQKSQMRAKQGGLSLISLILLAVIAIGLGMIGMQVVPTAKEYFAIKAALNKAVSGTPGDENEIRRQFDRSAAIDDISSIKGSDLVFEKQPGGVSVSFRYEKRIPLYGPASLLLDYQGTAKAKN